MLFQIFEKNLSLERLEITMSSTDSDQQLPDFAPTVEEAIENYDYEKAARIYQTHIDKHQTDISFQTEHYCKERDNINKEIQKKLEEEKANNQQIYENELQEAKSNLDKQITELSSQQLDEMKELEAKWREARESERAEIMKKVDVLLHSSQLLAKSHKFDEAIELRDKAFAYRDAPRHEEIEKVDKEYREQFELLLEKHHHVLNELITQYNSLCTMITQKLETNNQTAEAAFAVEEASVPLHIMNYVAEKNENREATIAVVKTLSPRKLNKKSLNSSPQSPN